MKTTTSNQSYQEYLINFCYNEDKFNKLKLRPNRELTFDRHAGNISRYFTIYFLLYSGNFPVTFLNLQINTRYFTIYLVISPVIFPVTFLCKYRLILTLGFLIDRLYPQLQLVSTKSQPLLANAFLYIT